MLNIVMFDCYFKLYIDSELLDYCSMSSQIVYSKNPLGENKKVEQKKKKICENVTFSYSTGNTSCISTKLPAR